MARSDTFSKDEKLVQYFWVVLAKKKQVIYEGKCKK